jgi:hypothetical protein
VEVGEGERRFSFTQYAAWGEGSDG